MSVSTGHWDGTPCAPFELRPAASKSLGRKHQGSSGGAWSACTHLSIYGLNIAPFFLRFLAMHLQPRNALEFGCGLGTTADFLARFTPGGARITCVEPNEMHTEVYLRRGLPYRPTQLAANLLNHNGEAVAACAAAVKTARFDLVYSLEVAEHIPVALHQSLVYLLGNATGRLLVFSASNTMHGTGHLQTSLRPKNLWIRKFQRVGMVLMPNLSSLASRMAYPERLDITKNVFVMRAANAVVEDTAEASHPALDRQRVFPWEQPLHPLRAWHPLNGPGWINHQKAMEDLEKAKHAQWAYEAALWPELHALAANKAKGVACGSSSSRSAK